MTFRSLLLLPFCLPAVILAADLVQQAGNTDDDRERQALLQKMASSSEVDQVRRKEAASMAEFVRRWNESGLKFYTASVRGAPACSWANTAGAPGVATFCTESKPASRHIRCSSSQPSIMPRPSAFTEG